MSLSHVLWETRLRKREGRKKKRAERKRKRGERVKDGDHHK